MRKRALKNLDNDLFQTGRLIVCGLYVNIILHDYLRVILGLNQTASTCFATFERSVPSEPERRTFGGLTRGPDGRYSDSDLARIWVESIEDAAGRQL
ncbi:Linoleate 10R-lipoxygenase like protein [Verticillium longisporum]|nr:Linoleate 10R-lipoxygenase like protein [Verticillium longisporum]